MITSTTQKHDLAGNPVINSAFKKDLNVNNGSAKTTFLIWLLMVLLTLLCIQMVMVAFGINKAYAQTQETQQITDKTAQKMLSSSISFGAFSTEKTSIKSVNKSAYDAYLIDKELNKSSTYNGLTRRQTHNAKRNEWLTTQEKSATRVTVQQVDFSNEFSIYDAYVSLFDDYDKDGFYHSFNVVFDADYYGNHTYADVYAELYISENGGPWYYYFSTDAFSISGDSEADSYEVFTTLYENYPDNYYNVLIDLYQVGYPGVVATISSDDLDALYALPLESEDFDTYSLNDDYHDHHDDHHGSLYGLLIMILFALLIRIRFS